MVRKVSLCPEQADSEAQKERAKGFQVMRKVSTSDIPGRSVVILSKYRYAGKARQLLFRARTQIVELGKDFFSFCNHMIVLQDKFKTLFTSLSLEE